MTPGTRRPTCTLRDRRRRAVHLRRPLRRGRLRGRLPRARAALLRRRGRGIRRGGSPSTDSRTSRSTGAISTGCSASSPAPSCAFENRSRSAFPDRSAARAPRQPRGAQRDGRLGADVAFGGVLAVADLGRRPRSNARPSARTASSTRGRGLLVSRSATGGSRRCASSSPRTRRRRSPTPRSGCGRAPAGWRSPTGPASCRRRLRRAMQAHDVDGIIACYSDRFVYDDRRRLSGDPIERT